ncbi:protein-histidine kinase [Gigaspora margarita]|uniref:histidine kinase n=1 Tax=Gigaspora margarita TaxID=4874 RepID=A0A8H4ERZ2_GIGMA|nr:protein-histidine kinase [Gigaspora margarita]
MGLDKGANNYLKKPFSARELIARIRDSIELSNLRRKILFQQQRQEKIKQTLFSISEMIHSRLDLKETLPNVLKTIHSILPCDRIFIISYEPTTSSRTLVALHEDPESMIPMDSSQEEAITNLHSQNLSSQMFLNNNFGVDISLNVYCTDTCKNASMLSAEIKVDDGCWGWIKLHRPPNSFWFNSEIDLLQRIANRISLAITYNLVMEENLKKDMQIKAEAIANKTKNQILANTSHELRTPLGAIVGILSSLDNGALTDEQINMIDIMTRASDSLLSIVNDILNAAKLEAHKIILINTTFDLLDLFEKVIEQFVEDAENKQIELILNYDVENIPRYVKSDHDRLKQVLFHLLSNSIKFTETGEVVMDVSIKSHKVIDTNQENQTYNQIVEKHYLFVELRDTGIGIDPKFIKDIWECFSQVDTSITRRQDGIGLGLSICKNLIAINGGEIEVESQLGKGCKFWFTWNIDPSPPNIPLNKQISYKLPSYILLKRILVIHPVKSARSSILKYLKMVEIVDAFDDPSKGIQEAKNYQELHNKSAYDIVFISLYEKNKEEVIKVSLELREMDINDDNLLIIFMVPSGDKGNALAYNLISKVGGRTAIIYSPVTWQKLTNLFSKIMDDDIIESKCILNDAVDYKVRQIGQDLYEDVNKIVTSSRSRSASKSKCSLCVDDDSTDLQVI